MGSFFISENVLVQLFCKHSSMLIRITSKILRKFMIILDLASLFFRELYVVNDCSSCFSIKITYHVLELKSKVGFKFFKYLLWAYFRGREIENYLWRVLFRRTLASVKN